MDMVTLGQYLQPTRHHPPVMRYVTPEEFTEHAIMPRNSDLPMSPAALWCDPLTHTDKQAAGETIR